jgi:hypothetical protein
MDMACGSVYFPCSAPRTCLQSRGIGGDTAHAWKRFQYVKIDRLIDLLNTFIAHISILSNAHGECWADVLACTQKVSHPEMRLVSAANGASFPFSLLRTLVHAGFCTFPQSCDYAKRLRDLYSACLLF